jgi:hypothetical protein
MEWKWAGGIAILLSSCGRSGSTFSGSDASASHSDAHESEAALPLFDANASDAGTGDVGVTTTLGCSADMQSVVNQSGVLVATCAPEQGCAAGKCIAACDAAAANRGTLGCDFWVSTPTQGFSDPPCFAMFLANAWGVSAVVKLSRAGQSYDPTKFSLLPSATTPAASWSPLPASGIPSLGVGILFLSQDPAAVNEDGVPITCPIAPADNTGNGTAIYSGGLHSSGVGSAWHVVTSVPVTGYDILPYGGAVSYFPSAELLIPSTAWGSNYYGIVPYRSKQSTEQWGQIVAAQDHTIVKVLPNVPLPGGDVVGDGGGVDAAPAGVTTTYMLNAGQFLQWQDTQEMSGTIISSNYPVGFVGGMGGQYYTSMTSIGGAHDSSHQQTPPVQALGSEYVVPPYTTRRASLAPESIAYRVVAVVDDTALTYDPPIAAAPAALSAGQTAEFETMVAFRVTSQDPAHPFYVGQMMSGCDVQSGSRPGCATTYAADCCLGDPDFVNILPPGQFLQKYVFFTDVTYGTTNLVFTRVKGKSGFEDVSLDCAGTLTGWQPIGSSGLYEITNIDLVRAQVPNGTCNNGPHVAQSKAPFGLMVWGLDWYASYGYPAGGNAALLNSVVVPPTPPK